MPHQLDDRKRLIVPRWRPFRVAARLGSINAGKGQPRPVPVVPGEVEKVRADWERGGTPGHAADLVDAALLAGRPEIAMDAAEFLLTADLGQVSRSVARAVLAREEVNSSDPPEIDALERHGRIAAAKRSLARHPRDPVLWVDVAREYSILGQDAQAEGALKRALILSPNDRFVLRAASRFFLHAHDPERAHAVLLRTARTKEDPWLLAAEIVAARAAGQESRWIRHGRSIVESNRFAPKHVSELSGAIGTLDHESGSRKDVRRMFERALRDPTENTVAQAAWMSRHRQSFALPIEGLVVPRAFEASAWAAVAEGEFNSALEHAWKWLRDEPFATRPAMFGSWIAATALGDYRAATAFVRAVEAANPDDPRLIAQRVFFHASAGELEEAEVLLSEMPAAVEQHVSGSEKAEWEVVMEADRGLIAFRRGHATAGQAHYDRAIRLAADNRLRETGATAFLYYAREVARAVPARAGAVIADARQLLDVFHPSVRHVYEQILVRAEMGSA